VPDRHGVELTRQLQRDERADLVALLRDLAADEWTRSTPCPNWTVADVAAHIVAWEGLLAGSSIAARAVASARLMLLAVRSRFNVHRLNDHLRQVAAADPKRILAEFDVADVDRWKWRFDRLRPGAQLAEYVIHHEDIRAAVGRPRDIPDERLRVALAGVKQLPGLGIRDRHRRQDRLSGSALLMHLAGR
jgi:uncharacterized protein (TIGR03083 family)